MKSISITEKTYDLIEKEAQKINKSITDYVGELMEEVTEIIPTKAEKKEWKGYLYNTLCFLATERPDFRPRKKDSLNTLLDSFFYWAEEYNDGYFSERDEADTDRYCAWLVQEYEKYC